MPIIQESPVIICGSPRAGTTLLAQICSLHSNLNILYETHCFPFFWTPFVFPKNKKIREQLLKFEKISPIVNKNMQNVVRNLFVEKNGLSSASDLFHSILSIYKSKYSDSVRIGEKTPSHLFYIDKIINLYPNSKIVIINRDPRAIGNSEKNRYIKMGISNFNHKKVAYRWYLTHVLVRKYQKKYGHERIFYLKFEDLIKKSQSSVLNLCNFLNLEFEQKMLDVGISFSSFDNKDFRGFNTNSLSRWKNMLSSDEVAIYEQILAKQLGQEGYPVFLEKEQGQKSNLKSHISQRFIKKGLKLIANVSPSILHYIIKDSRYRKFNAPM